MLSRMADTMQRTTVMLDPDSRAYAVAIAERAGLGRSLSAGIRLAVAELYRQQTATDGAADIDARVTAIEARLGIAP